jgi:hypothetical protein
MWSPWTIPTASSVEERASTRAGGRGGVSVGADKAGEARKVPGADKPKKLAHSSARSLFTVPNPKCP